MSDIKLDTGQINEVDREAATHETARIDSAAIIDNIERKGVVVDDKETLIESLDTLVEQFGIDGSVFESTKTALTLVAIADRHRRIKTDLSLDADTKGAGYESIADLVMLSVGPATRFSEEYESASDISGVSDEAVRKAYECFTQPELTADMRSFINGPKFDALRKRLGKDTRMDDFDVRVLSIAGRADVITYGLMPSVDWEDESLSYQEKDREHAARRDYEEGLFKNGDKFKEAMGRETSIPVAWVNTNQDGKKTLCIPSATAEKILYPDEARTSYYDDAHREDDVALLEHEFTHTQGMLLFGGKIGLGIALEELRAEHFSGDQHGYTDIKKFFMGMGMITGYTPKKAFERDGASYDEERFMLDIATHIGLDGLLDTLTAVPKNYVEDEHTNPYLKSMVENNGNGLSGLLERVYKKAIERDGEEVVKKRIDEAVDNLREHLKGNDIITLESWFNYGSPAFFAQLGCTNFRTRYPDESDNFDYPNLRQAT